MLSDGLHSNVISSLRLTENPLGVIRMDQGPVVFWFEVPLLLGHWAASTLTYIDK